MDSCFRFLTLGLPWGKSMLSCNVNAGTQLAEASWRRANECKEVQEAFRNQATKVNVD